MDIFLPGPIRRAIELLEAAGHETWLVGGSVRDHLLGAAVKDWDLVTSAPADAVRAVLADYPLVPVGARFGTLSLAVPGLKGEVSSFRGPDIVADLRLRDFTVNAMAWHPQRGLADPCGGRADLARRLLRCPGRAEDIFRADALRMVRAARFAAVLGFSVEATALAAIKELNALVDDVSTERIREELSRILVSPRPRLGIDLLRETGLLARILPELQACVGVEQYSPYHTEDVYRHTLTVVENTPPDLSVRLAALMHDIGKPRSLARDERGRSRFFGHEQLGAELAGKILRRLRYDNKTIAVVGKLVRHHMLRLNYPGMNPAKLLARVGNADVFRLFALQEADAGGDERSLEAIRQMRARVQAALAKGRPFARSDLAVSGRDLMELGIAPGPELGRVLDRLLEAVIDNPGLNEREKLLALARQLR